MRLRRLFTVREATPFSGQASSPMARPNPMAGQQQLGDTPSKAMLNQVEDLLHRVMAAEDNRQLGKVINQFLVDITPFMG